MVSKRNFYHLILKAIVVCMYIVPIILLLSGCQAKQKVYKVGILSDGAAFDNIGTGFVTKMTESGYLEGKNIVYDYQKEPNDLEKQKQYIRKFLDEKVDLIFAFPTGGAIAAREVTQGTNIPVVFYANLEGNNLVESVSNPGGNITGIRFPGPDLTVKRFEFLLEIAPKTKRLWITYGVNMPAIPAALELLRPAAASEGVELVEVPVTDVSGIQADLEARDQSGDIGMDAILIMPEGFSQIPEGWKSISTFAAKHNIPVGGSAAIQAETGAVFSYIPDNVEIGKLAAPLTIKILKGTSAGSIPVITPESSLRINYRLCQKLGLEVSESLLSRANEIIR